MVHIIPLLHFGWRTTLFAGWPPRTGCLCLLGLRQAKPAGCQFSKHMLLMIMIQQGNKQSTGIALHRARPLSESDLHGRMVAAGGS
jgi:hypothetical protein